MKTHVIPGDGLIGGICEDVLGNTSPNVFLNCNILLATNADVK